MTRRYKTKAIHIGNVVVGGGAPVVVQSMAKTDTRDVAATVSQIREMEAEGCELVRVAVPDMEAARAIADIKKGIRIPLIADIHFDHRLALEALRAGADALRLNPGNITSRQGVAQVVAEAKTRQAPIRIGVNAGSLPQDITQGTLAERMVAAALREIGFLEGLDFGLIKLSLKAFDVPTTVQGYRLMARHTRYPLHVGITEAGPPPAGTIRSAVGIGILLHQGIGDTIRVSLTSHPREEVRAAWDILKSLNLRQHGPVLVSCPTCGRCDVNLLGLVAQVEERLKALSSPLKVAVMGCEVNGPGEAREA
ncbi:MAG: flavodoxin-dependent (E)-4-hydroxy-3-methylbut-2-enyl-diphosphate synthase, partial [Chloroflexota bacterium]